MMSTTSLTSPFAASSRSLPCPRNGLLVVAKFTVCPAMHHDKNVARNVPSRQRCDSNAGCTIERYIFARYPLQQPEAVSLEFGDWLFIRCNLDHMRFIFLASRKACDRMLISFARLVAPVGPQWFAYSSASPDRPETCNESSGKNRPCPLECQGPCGPQ
jgi:hypothetical protein